MIQNDYHVPPQQWKTWNDVARHVFNETYGNMIDRPSLFQPVVAKPMRAANFYWRIVAWNAAFIAADSVRTYEQVDMAA
jgi:hypothetical protein